MKRELEISQPSAEPPTKQTAINPSSAIPLEEEKKTTTGPEIPVNPKQTPPQNPDRDRSKRKQKLIMIVGYNGLGFIGSQKQPSGVRTVEGEIEKTLYNEGFIAESNYGKLQKIGFSRATRTDKRVHALQNFFACKFLLDPCINDMKYYKAKIKKALPDDIKLFSLISTTKKFNTKLRCSSREYLYYLPSFCLWKDGKGKSLEEVYKYKATPEILDKLDKICKSFIGTHRFHNYTKYIDPKQMQANRHIFELKATPSLTIGGVEFIEFFLRGQSFLYNQIRKMIGMFISLCRNDFPVETIEKSFKKDEKIYVPLAPGEGLMLNRVLYDGYNKTKNVNKLDVIVLEEDKPDVENFKKELIGCIGKQEIEDKIFSNWLKAFDENELKHQEKEDEKEYQEGNKSDD